MEPSFFSLIIDNIIQGVFTGLTGMDQIVELRS